MGCYRVKVLLLERDAQARTALEMVLGLRGHHVEICQSHEELIERIEFFPFEFVIFSIDCSSSSLTERLKDIRAASQAFMPLLIGIIDEHDVSGLAPGAMEQINQVHVRPLDLDMLDLQFETLEQAARSRQLDQYDLSMPRMPAEALARLADRGIELGLLLDADGHIKFTTAGIEFITGHDPRLYHGRSVLSLIHPDDRAGINQLLTASDEESEIRARVMGDGERVTWFDIKIIHFATADGYSSFVMVGHRASQQTEIKNTGLYGEDLVAYVDEAGRIRYQTNAFAALLGTDIDSGSIKLVDYILEADRNIFQACLEDLPAAPGGQRRCYVRVHSADDRWRTLELICTNLLGIDAVDASVVNADDVTNRKSLEQHLMRRAFLDALTGLPNRVYFLNRLERALNRTMQSETGIAVLFLDLDRFKLINDSLGHEAGDRLLVAVGQRLKTAVRPGDIVARFGGDELIVLLEEIADEDEATIIADRIIEEIRYPLVIGGHEVSISTSIGIALSEPNMGDANLLIRNADIALYRAKELGPSRYTVFDEHMAQRVIERLELENALRHALDRGELSIEFLPELDLSDGRLAAFEVLTRWRHPERGDVEPATFMEVAEESGLIVSIGRWAFTEACSHIRRWHASNPTSSQPMIAVNMSVREFQQPDLVDFITSTLEEHDIPPTQLRIEIDERSLAADSDDTLAKVQTLRELGICFAIDNFGRGFSSLSIFTRFAFDMLKVDRQFISGNERLVRNLSIVRAVTSLAHALGMQVSAEGIETKEQLARVRAAGCDFGQGYLFTKSLDANTTEALFLSTGFNDQAA
ncbi:hypothetical protein BH23CHL2_BH23CHL2_34950 [soil metagenome]